MKINFYLESNKRVGDVKTIYCYVRSNNQTLKLSTLRKIDIKHWDSKRKIADITSTRNTKLKSVLKEINNHLGNFEDRIISIERILKGGDVTKRIHFDELKPAILEVFNPSPPPKQVTFFDAYDKYMDVKGKEGKFNLVKKLRRLKKILFQFNMDNKFTISFSNIDMNFKDDFIPYLNEVMNLQNNSAHHQVKLLKMFMTWALEREYHTNTVYKSKKFTVMKNKTKMITLRDNEIRILYRYNFDNERLERARDVFVFQCQVGARYSDIEKIDRNEIKGGIFSYKAQKTGDDVSVSLNQTALEILHKYSDWEKPLPVISLQKINKYIKEACEIVGFDETIITYTTIGTKRTPMKKKKYDLIATHTARRSFATNELIKGRITEAVMAEMGHSNYDTFKNYINEANILKDEREKNSNKSHLRIA